MTKLSGYLIALLLPLAFQPAHGADAPKQALKTELEAMMESDQLQRSKIQEASERLGEESPEVQALWEAQSQSDERNIKRLVEIVDVSGWPKRSEVGAQASVGAFLVLQHASLEQQKRFLPLMREAASKGEARNSDLALLEDRVLVREGKKQIYGSQLSVDPKSGTLRFDPIEDPANVDKRRAAMGLDPIAEYAKNFGIEYRPEG